MLRGVFSFAERFHGFVYCICENKIFDGGIQLKTVETQPRTFCIFASRSFRLRVKSEGVIDELGPETKRLIPANPA
jgi:hypothetical protein